MHLSVMVKEIQAGYLNSSYFKEKYLYLAPNRLPSSKSAIRKGRNASRKLYLFRFIIT